MEFRPVLFPLDEMTLGGLARPPALPFSPPSTPRPPPYPTAFPSPPPQRAPPICSALTHRRRHPHPIAHPTHIASPARADAEPRGPRGRRRGALQPLRRARRRHLPERLHPPLPHGAHRQLRPARERDRPDLHQPEGTLRADDLSPAAALR